MDTKTRPPLAVGQTWRTRNGEKVTIDHHDLSDPAYPFRAAGLWYTAGGLCCDGGGDDPDDLIELLSPALAAPPTPRRFAETPRRTVWRHTDGLDYQTLDALADDGTAWWMVCGETDWQQLPPLPDCEASHD